MPRVSARSARRRRAKGGALRLNELDATRRVRALFRQSSIPAKNLTRLTDRDEALRIDLVDEPNHTRLLTPRDDAAYIGYIAAATLGMVERGGPTGVTKCLRDLLPACQRNYLHLDRTQCELPLDPHADKRSGRESARVADDMPRRRDVAENRAHCNQPDRHFGRAKRRCLNSVVSRNHNETYRADGDVTDSQAEDHQCAENRVEGVDEHVGLSRGDIRKLHSQLA